MYRSGSAYICVVAHTSGDFATDLGAGNWDLFAQQGSSGAGSGDLLAANDLSDLNDADTALGNLGGTTSGRAIFKAATYDAVLTLLGATTVGKALLQAASAAAQRTALGLGGLATQNILDEDDMASDSATRPSSQQASKAYTDANASIGISQTWQDVSGSRTAGASYQNTTGRPIQAAIVGEKFKDHTIEVSSTGAWAGEELVISKGERAVATSGYHRASACFTIPHGWYYRYNGGTYLHWSELR